MAERSRQSAATTSPSWPSRRSPAGLACP